MNCLPLMQIFNTNADYTLEDARVILRPLCREDFSHLLSFALEEPAIWTYSLVSAAGRQGMNAYIEKALSDRDAGIAYPFIVFDKAQQAYAGSTRYYDIQLLQKNLQLGYTWYGSAFQGTGINVHCKYLMLSFAFDTIGMERVEFRADARNARSVAAMKKIGCVEEGTLRQHYFLEDGSRRDSIILSILKKEWHDTVKNNLARLIE